MIGRAVLPDEYLAWNRRWAAPFGPNSAGGLWSRLPSAWAPKRLQYFAHQLNSTTRTFEYPWAFEMAGDPAGCTIVEIGGGLSGLQFVLSKCGARVINVDPFLDYGGNDYSDQNGFDPEAMLSALNREFGTDVELRRTTMSAAELPDRSAHTALCLSTLEHLTEDELCEIVTELPRVLAVGGRAVITVDLFLDLEPFTKQKTNKWGRNLDIARLIEDIGMSLAVGDRRELHGFPEFDAARILSERSQLFEDQGSQVVAQAFVLEHHEAAPEADRA